MNDDERISKLTPLQEQAADEPTADTVTAIDKDRSELDHPSVPARAEGIDLDAIDEKRYEVQEEHGRGGLGRVLRAWDRQIGRDVAIKELLLRGGDAESRFFREASITGRLEHPSIVPVHELGRRPDGTPFYCMKMVEGQTLKRVAAEAKTLGERIALLPHVLAVAEAVAYAHSRHIIHRDLKPSNVLVGEFGETVVVDWGLAKVLADTNVSSEDPARDADLTTQSGATIVGQVLGTPAYMSPEQARGEEVDECADVYSLGAILYQVLAGRRPFDADSSRDMLELVRKASPTPLEELQPKVPADLAAIVRRAMARDKHDRYANAGELAQDLRRFGAGQMVHAHAYQWSDRIVRWVRRHRTLAAALTATLLVSLVASVWGFRSEQRLRRESQAARDRADQRSLVLLEEQGRLALLSDLPRQAAADLEEAARRGADDRALRLMLGRARQLLAASPPYRELAVAEDARSFTFSSDRKLVAVTGEKATEVWDVVAGERLWAGEPAPGGWQPILFSPDDSLLALGFASGDLRVWGARTGELVASARVSGAEDARVMAISFSPDGSRLFATALNGSAAIWDTTNWQPHVELPRMQSPFVGAFSPDGSLVATGDEEGLVRIWRARDGRQMHLLRGHTGSVWALAFNPDGRILGTAGGDGTVRLWNPASGESMAVMRAPTRLYRNIAFSPRGDRVVTACYESTAIIWSVPDGTRIAELVGHAAPVYDAQFDATGDRVATASYDGTVRIWTAHDGYPLGVMFGQRGFPLDVRFGPGDGQVVAASIHGPVGVWELREPFERSFGPCESSIGWAELSPDDAFVVAACENGEATVFDSRTGEQLQRIDLGGPDVFPEVSAEFSPDGTRLVGYSRKQPTPKIWDWRRGEVVTEIDLGDESQNGVAFSPDGGRILVLGDKSGRVVDIATGRTEVTLSDYERDSYVRPAWSPDGALIAAADLDGSVAVWDARTGEHKPSWRGHARFPERVEFDSAGNLAVSAGWDGTARIWDAHSGKSLQTLRSGSTPFMDAAFGPDSLLVATGDSKGFVSLWEVSSGRQLYRFRAHTNAVVSVDISTDGRRLLTGSWDGFVRLWELPSTDR